MTEQIDGLSQQQPKSYRIAEMLEQGMRRQEIASAAACDGRYVDQIKRNIKRCGTFHGKEPQEGDRIFTLPPEPPTDKVDARFSHRPQNVRDLTNYALEADEILTWAGAFRKVAEYCKECGYEDAYEFAQAVAKAKQMAL